MSFQTGVLKDEKLAGTVLGTPEHGGVGGSAPPALKERGQGCKSALPTLPNDLIFLYFLLTFLLLLGPIFFYLQDSMTCHEMQQWLGAYVCEK